MLIITQTALELGFLYALVAMALFLSYRILDIADMTTDGCFVLGAAVSVSLTTAGHPILAIPAAMLAGACAGFATAFLQTRLGVPSILAGIVTNTGLYTVNLMAMGWKANQSLLGGSTIFTLLRDTGIGGKGADADKADRGGGEHHLPDGDSQYVSGAGAGNPDADDGGRRHCVGRLRPGAGRHDRGGSDRPV